MPKPGLDSQNLTLTYSVGYLLRVHSVQGTIPGTGVHEGVCGKLLLPWRAKPANICLGTRNNPEGSRTVKEARGQEVLSDEGMFA